MSNRSISNIKLGIFVLSGLVFLVLLLYMIGRNSNLFGNTYQLKVRFRNIQGLVTGNNVRYAGIETGTVKKIAILNDTVIEVTIVLEEDMKSIIRKNSLASIGTEGLVGNKVINIMPASQPGALAEENDLLQTAPSVDTEVMLQTLDQVNRDIAEIASEVKRSIQQINSSSGIFSLVNDTSVPDYIKASISNLHQASFAVNVMAHDLQGITARLKNGEGSLGELLTDTAFAHTIIRLVDRMQIISNETDSLVNTIHHTVEEIRLDIYEGNGTLHSLLRDSTVFLEIHSSLQNIQKGTESFHQNMEALKHNFLLKGYFRKQARNDPKIQKEVCADTLAGDGK